MSRLRGCQQETEALESAPVRAAREIASRHMLEDPVTRVKAGRLGLERALDQWVLALAMREANGDPARQKAVSSVDNTPRFWFGSLKYARSLQRYLGVSFFTLDEHGYVASHRKGLEFLGHQLRVLTKRIGMRLCPLAECTWRQARELTHCWTRLCPRSRGTSY